MQRVVVGMALLTQGAQQFTGTGTYVRELLSEFAKRPDEIHVEALCNEHAAASVRAFEASNVRLTEARGFRIGTSSGRRAATLLSARVHPQRLARQFAPGTEIVHYPLTLGVPAVQLPRVVSLHDVQHHDLPLYFSATQRRWRRILYDAPARRATLVITLSEHSKQRIVDVLGIAAERIIVIPLAADAQRFRPESGARDDELVADLDLPARFLFYPATLWPHKNHIGLLEAFARVGDPDLHLVLCGASFGRLEEVRAAAAKLGIARRVRHVGFIAGPALPAVYRKATALVFPSTYEGFGVPVLEAMASGCPVASTHCGPLAEVCGDGAAVLHHADPDQMSDVIAAIATDQGLRSRLRDAGLQRARCYSWERAAQAHIAVYRRARGTD